MLSYYLYLFILFLWVKFNKKKHSYLIEEGRNLKRSIKYPEFFSKTLRDDEILL